MPLRESLEREGDWLFRWRSFLPIACIPLILLAQLHQKWPLGSPAFEEVWEIICLGLSFLGLGVRILAVGYAAGDTSGRNTKHQAAASLNTTGIYATVRHPLYLGNFLIGLGGVLVPFVAWLPAIYVLAFWLYYERIMMAEEAFLSAQFGDVFQNWARRTPAFIPRPSHWTTPLESFSFKSVLRREYSGFLLVILLHCSIEEFEHRFIENRWIVDPFWTTLLCCGLATYVTLRALKRRTTYLDVPGR